jgi:hypothetical protein
MLENTEGEIKKGNPEKRVPYVTSFSGLSFFIALSVFSNFYLSCVLCILWCQLDNPEKLAT